MCMDYKALNWGHNHRQILILIVDELLDELHEDVYFSK